MADRAWKRQERQVAALMGSRRNPNNGEHRTDIDAGPFAIEHKARKSLPVWLTGALQQARSAAGDRTPIVILSAVSQGVKAHRYVFMDFDDWRDWYGGEGSDDLRDAARDAREQGRAR